MEVTRVDDPSKDSLVSSIMHEVLQHCSDSSMNMTSALQETIPNINYPAQALSQQLTPLITNWPYVPERPLAHEVEMDTHPIGSPSKNTMNLIAVNDINKLQYITPNKLIIHDYETPILQNPSPEMIECIDKISLYNSKQDLLEKLNMMQAENISLKQKVTDLEGEVSNYKKQIDILEEQARNTETKLFHIMEENKKYVPDSLHQHTKSEDFCDKKNDMNNDSEQIGENSILDETQIDVSNIKVDDDQDEDYKVNEDAATSFIKKKIKKKKKEFTRKYKKKKNNNVNELNEYFPHSKRLYNCSQCDKKFVKQITLDEHLWKHTGEKPYTCEICGKKFTRLETVKNHKMRIHEGIKPPKYCCEVCGGSYENMSVHLLSHSPVKRYGCSECDHRCNTSAALKEHMVKHTGEKSFCCNVCGKLSGTASNHKKHMMRHSGEKPYQCPVCDQRFLDAYSLKLHARIHTGEKPFSCELCPKQFRLKSRLDQHKLVHSGERPFSCVQCGQRFVQRAHRNTHMNLVHRKKHKQLSTEFLQNQHPLNDVQPNPLVIHSVQHLQVQHNQHIHFTNSETVQNQNPHIQPAIILPQAGFPDPTTQLPQSNL